MEKKKQVKKKEISTILLIYSTIELEKQTQKN